MNAIMRKTIRRKRNLKTERNKFNYILFSKNLQEFKDKNNLTYQDISEQTRIGMSVIARLIKNEYRSDLSLNYAITICELINEELCKYIKD